MDKAKRKVLVLVEGEKTDVALMERLFQIYALDLSYEIVSYRTNIYTLYHEMFENNQPEDVDLLQMLKARESNQNQKSLFNEVYSDILLIFDLDPQDGGFTPAKIRDMASYFVESSDMGKLYINYPMVESFYHMADIPDLKFDDYNATLQELCERKYKARVNRINRNGDYRKFAVTREECNTVIQQNIEKGWKLLNTPNNSNELPDQLSVLDKQLEFLSNLEDAKVSVLCTCPFFIPEYNPSLITSS